MAPITEKLLRKRSEHNDGLLSDLQEIALHQEEIECIPPLLQTVCRHLKIILLQNNVIEKIEHMNKLKELEYLNLALNSISVVENLGRCESLKKLDLTVNFVDLDTFRESVLNLSECAALEDLYFVGNPCMQWEFARPYIIAHIPWLKQLDGNLVTPSERLQAKRQLPKLEAELKSLAQKCYDSKQQSDYKPVYTKEERLEEYRVVAQQKALKDKNSTVGGAVAEKEKTEIPVYNSRGEIRQCNEGKYEFKFDETGSEIILTVAVPKFLDTSQIDVDLQSTYIRCSIKGKILQLSLSEDIDVCNSGITRAKVTGELRITMAKLNPRITTRSATEQPAPIAVIVPVRTADRPSSDMPPPLERIQSM